MEPPPGEGLVVDEPLTVSNKTRLSLSTPRRVKRALHVLVSNRSHVDLANCIPSSSLAFSEMDKFLLGVHWALRFLMFLLWCLACPILRLQSFRKRQRLPPIRNKTLLLSGTELARRIRNREIRSEEVVQAFIARCKAVNPIVNAIVEARFDAALQEAREVDAFLSSTERTREELAEDLPLLGLPVTVKESIAVKGMSHMVGVKKKTVERASEDATAVGLIRKAGGIVLLVSNTPEFCFFWETYNNVTGVTYNPYDSRRVAGGSSGGEAALLGAGASILSVASDIAGSARLPAMFCGVFGHKPTPRWIPWEGHRPESKEEVWPNYFTLGSMVRYAEDLPLLLKVMAASPEIRKSFNRQVSVRDLKVFYAETDGSNIVHPIDPEILLAARRLKNYIEKTHHTKVEKANVSGLEFAFDISSCMLLKMDGVENIFSKGGDHKEWNSITLEVLKIVSRMSSHTLHAAVYGIAKRAVDKFPKKHHDEMLNKAARLKKQFQDLLDSNGVLIFPSFCSPAYFPYETYYNVVNYHYMTIFNALGLPVTQCPLGLNSQGLPIGVQIVANAGCDHLTLAMAQEIQRGFGGWQEPSAERYL